MAVFQIKKNIKEKNLSMQFKISPLMMEAKDPVKINTGPIFPCMKNMRMSYSKIVRPLINEVRN